MYIAGAREQSAPWCIRVSHDDKGSLALQLLGDSIFSWERQQLDGRLALRVDGDNAVSERGLLAGAEEARAELHRGLERRDDIGDDAGFLEADRKASVGESSEDCGAARASARGNGPSM